jgi:hypothetical protein
LGISNKEARLLPPFIPFAKKEKKKKPQGTQELVKKTKETSLNLAVMETNV